MDGSLSRQADHAPVQLLGGGRAKSAPAIWTTASSARRPTSSARSSTRSTAWRRELATSQRKLERSRLELERKGHNLEGRKRLHRDAAGAHRHGRRLGRRRGRVSTINTAASRLLGVDRSVVGQPAADVFGRADLQPLATLLQQGAPVRRSARAGDRADVRGTRRPPGGRRDRAARRGRRGRRHRHRHGRRHAADPGAARGDVARRRAPARARDQEPAHADPAVRRTAAPAFHLGAAARALAGRRVHRHDHRRSRFAEGAGRRVLAVCAHAPTAHGRRRISTPCISEAVALYDGLFSHIDIARALCRRSARRPRRPRADPPRDHQPRRQRDRSARRAAPAARPRRAWSASRRSTTRRSISCAWSWPTTGPAFRPAIATSCSCRTTRRRSGEAASASPSSAASSSSTAAASRWRQSPTGTQFVIELPRKRPGLRVCTDLTPATTPGELWIGRSPVE